MPYFIIGRKDGSFYTLAESTDYSAVWEKWQEDPVSKAIVFFPKELRESQFFSGDYYVAFLARRPGVYGDYAEAVKQTDNVGRKPSGYSTYLEACRAFAKAAKAGEVIRREDTTTELMRKSCGCCWYCGKTLTDDFGNRGWGQKEHQIPKHREGTNSLGNLVYACHACNVEEKNWRDVEQLRAKWAEERRSEYPDGQVVFFGERTREQRHAIQQSKDPAWECPSTDSVICAP